MRSSAKACIKPIGSKRSERESDTVASLSRDLEQAARGEDIAWALSGAMATVDNHFRNQTTEPLSKIDRDRLLIAISRAQAAAAVCLPATYSREQIVAGMEALAAQVMVWAEDPKRTAQRAPNFLSDTRAYARMFRNDLHNMSLLDEIQMRSWQRRDAEIKKLMKPDNGSEAAGA